MSLKPVFAADARSQWRELDCERQEVVLDLLNRLTADPPPDGEHVADDVGEVNRVRHDVFIHVLIEHNLNRLTVMGCGHTTRPAD